MEQYIDKVTIGYRIWEVHATIETDGTISFVRMTWGITGERLFRPGEENDTVTKAGIDIVRAKLALSAIEYTTSAEEPEDDSDFEVIEKF